MRRRLRQLRDAGLIRSFPYGLTERGKASSYWKLTRDGFRIVYDQNAPLPKRTYFDAIRPGHHYHSYCLADVLVHLLLTAKQNGCELVHVARENSVKLEVDSFALFPDLAFVVRNEEGKSFPFVVELDNGTERIRSKQDIESVERKLRGYDAHQAKYDKFDKDRYLVIFIATRSKLRLENILQTAGAVMTEVQRRVFIGTTLSYLL